MIFKGIFFGVVGGSLLWLLIGIVVWGLCGCTSTYAHYDRYAEDGKTKVSELSVHRRTFISKVSMPEVEFKADGTAVMKGYENDGGNGVVAGAVEAACKGAVKGAVGK